MSRLMFTGLPSDLTEEKFRLKLTAPKELGSLNVTDVRLKSKRRFAFVGYKTAKEAKTSKEYFHRSYAFGNERIQVHVVDDKQLDLHHGIVLPTTVTQPRPTLVPAPSLVSNEAEGSQTKKDSSQGLKEFMTVMKGTDVSKPDTETPTTIKKDKKGKGKEKEIVAEPRASREQEQDLTTYPGWAQMSRLQQKGVEYMMKKRQQERAQAKEDAARAAWAKNDGEIEAAAPVASQRPGKAKDEYPHLPPSEKIIMQHRRLYVRNLAHVTTTDELSEEFSKFGEVEEAYIPVAKEKGTHKGTALGYGFVLYKNAEHALAAFRMMDQATFQGRIIHVMPAGPKYGKQPEVESEEASGEASAGQSLAQGQVLGKVKQGHAEVTKKKEKQSTLADKHGVNWATMYMDVYEYNWHAPALQPLPRPLRLNSLIPS